MKRYARIPGSPGCSAPLGEINVALFFIHTQDHHRLLPAHLVYQARRGKGCQQGTAATTPEAATFDMQNSIHLMLPTHFDQLGDRADTPPGKLAEQNHALDSIVLQQRDVGAHLSYRLDLFSHRSSAMLGMLMDFVACQRRLDRTETHLHHNHIVDLRILGFIHAAVLMSSHGCWDPPCDNRARLISARSAVK